MRFRFLAENIGGEVVRGEVDAGSKVAAEKELERNGLKIQLLQFCDGDGGSRKSAMGKFLEIFRGGARATAEWKCVFFEQLSMLLAAGLPIERCLATLAAGSENSKSAAITGLLKEKIFAGMALSEAMGCCGSVFSATEVKTVSAAEGIGRPSVALQELAAFGKKMSTARKKVKAALVYPAIVLTVACLALAMLMIVVVPKFEEIFASQSAGGQRLPLLTRRIIGACEFFGAHFAGLSVLLVALVVALKICLSRRTFRAGVFAFLRKLPIFGKLLLTMDVSNFFRTIGMLMSFGVPMQDALEVAVGVVNGGAFKRFLGKVLERIAHGESLSSGFAGSKLLAATAIGLIFAGERSGNLAKSFAKIAEIYDGKVESALTLLTTLIEPAIIVLLAIAVGTIVVAMFLPMVSMMQSIKI
ncbi:MAG: type II secretion system F family protein [Puniceicoccales bacterium]|nr:type II secretion system F family protein [Puniceicoccales bacterium]